MRLDLTGNSVQKVKNYREIMFKTLSKLKVLDGTDKNDNYVSSDDNCVSLDDDDVEHG